MCTSISIGDGNLRKSNNTYVHRQRNNLNLREGSVPNTVVYHSEICRLNDGSQVTGCTTLAMSSSVLRTCHYLSLLSDLSLSICTF